MFAVVLVGLQRNCWRVSEERVRSAQWISCSCSEARQKTRCSQVYMRTQGRVAHHCFGLFTSVSPGADFYSFLFFQRFRTKFADQAAFTVKQFKAEKHHWSDNRNSVTLQVDTFALSWKVWIKWKQSVVLKVTPSTVDQIDLATGRILCSYEYQEIEGFAVVSVQSPMGSFIWRCFSDAS